MCNMFLIYKTVYFINYADDNTPLGIAHNIGDVIRSVEEVGENRITWFSDNQMKVNPEKCHQLLNSKEQTTTKISNLHIIPCVKKY